MLTARNYRLYPSVEQQIHLAQHFGCHRLVNNDANAFDQSYYRETGKHVSQNDLINRLPALKNERRFLKEVDSQMLQQSVMDFCRARENFFVAKRGYPKFKTRRSHQSVRFPQRCSVDEIIRTVVVPKIGVIRAVIHRPVAGIVKSITICKNAAGQYHAAVLVEDGFIRPEESVTGRTIGVDLGLKEFLVTSENERIDNPKHFNKNRKNLKRKQQQLARCKKESNRRRKAVLHVAKVHLRIANQRKDFHHKLSRLLVDENQVIVVENLNVKGMMQNHCLASGIGDVGWHRFVGYLRYKANREGKVVLKCGRFIPSSKTCSCCGTINRKLMLSDRTWTCDRCGVTHDRDHNAAINISRGGLIEEYPIWFLLNRGILVRA